MFRRFLNMVDATASTVVEYIVETSENAANSVAVARLNSASNNIEDQDMLEHMVNKLPIPEPIFDRNPNNRLSRLADSIEVIITEYRIRIRTVRRTGSNQYKILEESLVHNCKYIQDFVNTSTNNFVQEMSDDIETQKYRIIIAAEEQVNAISTSIGDWFVNLSTEAEAFKDEFTNKTRIIVDDARENLEEFKEYVEDDLIDDTVNLVTKVDNTMYAVNRITRTSFQYDQGVIEYDSDIEEREHPEPTEYNSEIICKDGREEIEEEPEEGFVDKYLLKAFDLAPTLQTYDYNLKPFVKEKFQKPVFEYKYEPSIYNAYQLAATLGDADYEAVFVEVHPIERFNISPDGENFYDYRSDFHNSGKLTRSCDELVKYQVTTTEMSRDIKPIFIWKLIKETLNTISDPTRKFRLSNVLNERQHIHEILISPELLAQISSPKTLNIGSSSAKAQLNLDLAIRTNSSVNLPYNMAYSRYPIRENTAYLAAAIRDSMKWNHYGSGLNFQL